ncbi:MAG: hypothetical protein V3W19_03395 [Desulfatiglandales bacterium]
MKDATKLTDKKQRDMNNAALKVELAMANERTMAIYKRKWAPKRIATTKPIKRMNLEIIRIAPFLLIGLHFCGKEDREMRGVCQG